MQLTNLHAVATQPNGSDVAIDEEAMATVFRYTVDHGGIEDHEAVAHQIGLPSDQVTLAVQQLLHSRLLRQSPDRADRLVAVDPAVAAAVLVSPIEQEISQKQELIAQVRSRADRLRAEFEAADRNATVEGEQIIDHVHGEDEIHGHLELAAKGCADEILVVWEGSPDVPGFRRLLDLCQDLLAEGRSVRLVCQHRTRADLVTRASLRQLTEDGAELRTLAQVPCSAVVVDRASALLLGDSALASRVHDRTTVSDFLLPMFDHLWDAAVAADLLDVGYAAAAADLQRSLLSLMAQGHTDEVVARKLGMSVRSCRRHIAALMREFGAVSRFQAGVQAGRSDVFEGC